MSKAARILLIVGLLLTFGLPLLGVVYTASSVLQTFHQLNQTGITTPNELAGHIGNGLVGTIFAMIGFVLGVFVLLAAGMVIYAEKRTRLRYDQTAQVSTTPPHSF